MCPEVSIGFAKRSIRETNSHGAVLVDFVSYSLGLVLPLATRHFLVLQVVAGILDLALESRVLVQQALSGAVSFCSSGGRCSARVLHRKLTCIRESRASSERLKDSNWSCKDSGGVG